MSHVTCHMSNAYVDRWDMLINFCFHVYAQKSLFIGENGNVFLDVILSTLSCEFRVHRAGSQLKMLSTHMNLTPRQLLRALALFYN